MQRPPALRSAPVTSGGRCQQESVAALFSPEGLPCLAAVQPSSPRPPEGLSRLLHPCQPLALPAAAPRGHLAALTCGEPQAPPGWAGGRLEAVSSAPCALVRGLVVRPMPHLRSIGGDGTRHARAHPLWLEGWGAALELLSEPQRAGGSGGLGSLGGLGLKQSRPGLPQERASFVAGRSLVTVGLRVKVRGDPGEGPRQDVGG